jgi:hypothetical protein
MLNPLVNPKFRLGEAATETTPVPAKLNACPTSPRLKPTPPLTVAGLLPVTSLPFPSAGHQLTRPGGGFTHAAESWLGIIETAHANANIAIMYRFIIRLSSFVAKTARSIEFFRSGYFLGLSFDLFYHAFPIPSNLFFILK